MKRSSRVQVTENSAADWAKRFRAIFLPIAGFVVAGSLTGCVVVGASSRGGFFIWPGGLGLVLLILLVLFLLRRR